MIRNISLKALLQARQTWVNHTVLQLQCGFFFMSGTGTEVYKIILDIS